MTIIFSALVMFSLAVLMAWALGWANQAFHVDVDPRIVKIRDALPGTNCGGCGFAGCDNFAEAVAEGKAPPDGCPVGGPQSAKKIADIMGTDFDQNTPQRPVVHCTGRNDDKTRAKYEGEQNCAAANLVGGVQSCVFGCLGFGDCVEACNYDAIQIIEGLAVVDYEKCIGCGACVTACPRDVIEMVPFKSSEMIVVACSNQDPGKQARQACKVACIGCKLCVKQCEDLFAMEGNLATIDYDKYDPQSIDDAQAALDKCPMDTIRMVGQGKQN